jgi:hypothetical protein
MKLAFFFEVLKGSFCLYFNLSYFYCREQEDGRDLRKMFLVEPSEFTWSFCTHETKSLLWVDTALWSHSSMSRWYLYAAHTQTSRYSLAECGLDFSLLLILKEHPMQGATLTNIGMCSFRTTLSTKSMQFPLPLFLCGKHTWGKAWDELLRQTCIFFASWIWGN